MNNNDNIALKNKIREQMRKEKIPALSEEIREKIRANNKLEHQQEKSCLKQFIDKTKSIADEVLDDN